MFVIIININEKSAKCSTLDLMKEIITIASKNCLVRKNQKHEGGIQFYVNQATPHWGHIIETMRWLSNTTSGNVPETMR